MTKQIYSGYRIHIEANQLGIPAIPQTIKGASGDIVQSLREGPVNFELDELNRLLINNGGSSGSGGISIALASIATETSPGSGTWNLNATTTIAVGTTLTIASGITFIIPSGLTLTVNGTLQVSNGGAITTLGTLINNSNQTVQVDEFALFSIDGGTCTNNGTFINDGRLDISNGGSLQVAEGSTIENNGDVYVYGSGSFIVIAAGGTFANSGGVNTSGQGSIGGGGVITGSGTEGSAAPPVCEAQTFTTPLAQDETVEVCQSFTVDPEATFTIPAGVTFTNNGIMTVCGELIINGTFINNAYVNFDISGAICKIYKDSPDASGNFINDGTCINNGSIYVYDDGTLENNGSLVNLSIIKYGNGSGSCGTGNFIGPYQGVPPTVGCPAVPVVLRFSSANSTQAPSLPAGYTIPAGYIYMDYLLIGGGGGGADTAGAGQGFGGGSGGIRNASGVSVTEGMTLTVNLGMAGIPGNDSQGGSGSSTSLTLDGGSAQVASGGSGGGTQSGSGGAGGTPNGVAGTENGGSLPFPYTTYGGGGDGDATGDVASGGDGFYYIQLYSPPMPLVFVIGDVIPIPATVPVGYTTLTYTIIGGGGGGSASSGSNDDPIGGGGGGGSGGIQTGTLTVSGGNTISLSIGTFGDGAPDSTYPAGEDGGSTILTIGGSEIMASGGTGGGKPNIAGAGGTPGGVAGGAGDAGNGGLGGKLPGIYSDFGFGGIGGSPDGSMLGTPGEGGDRGYYSITLT